MACGAIFAASHPETATYIDGNLAGIAPNTGGTLTFDPDNAMHLRVGQDTVEVPYAAISSAELGSVKETAHHQPLYKKVMIFHRHSNTETQYLIVHFKAEGEEKAMTLEVAKADAPEILDTLKHGGQKTAAEPKYGDWWGDEYWKTPRNADKWGKSAGSQEQR